eukprot:7493161-Alexandrium_andersonii.AAC.1
MSLVLAASGRAGLGPRGKGFSHCARFWEMPCIANARARKGWLQEFEASLAPRSMPMPCFSRRKSAREVQRGC